MRKRYIGMVLTLLGIAFMAYALYYSAMSPLHKIMANEALMYVFGTYFIILGGVLWIGEVPREVISRVRREALGAKKGGSS